MIDRRTFLKLSAGALVLTAAGALTGCGGMNDRPKVTIDGVVFMCEAPVITGGSGYAVRYCPLFAIQNDTGERVILEPKDITGTFTDMENNMYPLEFIRNELTVGRIVIRNMAVQQSSVWKVKIGFLQNTAMVRS